MEKLRAAILFILEQQLGKGHDSDAEVLQHLNAVRGAQPDATLKEAVVFTVKQIEKMSQPQGREGARVGFILFDGADEAAAGAAEQLKALGENGAS